MAIVAICSGCKVRLTLGDDRAGETIECPRCDAAITIPPAGSRTPAEPPPPAAPRPLPPPLPAGATPPVSTGRPLEPLPPPEPLPGPGWWANRRIRLGLLVGAGVLLATLIALFAFRGPTDTPKPDPDPPIAGTPAPTGTAGTGGTTPPPSGSGNTSPGIGQPTPPTGVPDQYNLQFLGSQGQGRRFCIIADNSGSMGGAKIADLKKQLLKTLSELDRQGEFYIFFFNFGTTAMPHPTWLKAGAPETDRIRTWIESRTAGGGTLPEPAFEAAFKLSPPPDVIFFMTDGLIPATVPARVVALNKSTPKVIVNTIMFTQPGKGKFIPKGGILREEDALKRIAEQSGGTFTRYTP